ncbi:hypothetical protein [Streptomyces sp. Wh19]|uniref:hypothetical protein n=1 Tax=Streptomyces sp. Wh19 TaxID=3076629 RepID=UPI003FA39EFF
MHLPVGEAVGLPQFTYMARQAERHRYGQILLVGDAAHLFLATGVAVNAGMADPRAGHGPDCWAPTTPNVTSSGAEPCCTPEPLREVFQELLTDEQSLRRMGTLVAGADIRYPTPGACHHPMTGSFAPRPRPAHRQGRNRCCATPAPRTARPARSRRPPGPPRGRPGLTASLRRPVRQGVCRQVLTFCQAWPSSRTSKRKHP